MPKDKTTFANDLGEILERNPISLDRNRMR